MYFNSAMRYNATKVDYWWFWTKDSYYGHPTKNSTEVTVLPTCRSHDFLNTSRYFSPYSLHDSARDVKRIETSRQNSATTPAPQSKRPIAGPSRQTEATQYLESESLSSLVSPVHSYHQ
jgi:hypothetical protein